MSLRKDNN